MKIKLYSNGQIINPPERVAQRYIRLGRACLYVEPKPEPKLVIEPEPVIEVREEIPEEVIFREFEPIEEPVEEVKPKRKTRKKKEEIFEG